MRVVARHGFDSRDSFFPVASRVFEPTVARRGKSEIEEWLKRAIGSTRFLGLVLCQGAFNVGDELERADGRGRLAERELNERDRSLAGGKVGLMVRGIARKWRFGPAHGG